MLPHTPAAGHTVCFYDDDALLVDEVGGFLADALELGGAAILITTPEHRDAVLRRLPGRGDAAALHVLDAAATLEHLLVEDWPDAQRFDETIGPVVAAAAAGGRRVRAYGEMVGLLCAAGRHDAALRLEQFWNGLSRRHTFELLCGYRRAAFSGAEHLAAFRRICCQHDRVCSSEQLQQAWRQGSADRLVALWQQKAHALETEVARRREAERLLRRREAELEDFVENAAEGLHRVAGDGTILWANRAELQLLGYAREEYVGRHIAEFHVDADVIAEILRRLNAGETLYDQPARLRSKDGSIKHVLIHSNGCFENGQLQYTRCFTRDASDRMEQLRSRAELERAYAEREVLLRDLEAASRAKDEFLAMLGHELRNPLSPIVTALQLMRMRGDTHTARERAIIERQVEHLVRLVDDLLDIARLTRGKIQLECERVVVADVLAKAVEMASPLLEQRRHQLLLAIEPELRWEGDPVRLAQAVANLLTNAARYTEPGGSVRLSARRDADVLLVAVQDNGRGITAEVLPHVFDLFFQGRRGVDRAEGGLGIGLALVKTIVELHGGRVAAASAGSGRGSEFTLRLPLAESGAEPVPALPALPPEPARVARRVLVVDDNEDAAELLGTLLRAAGHEVHVAHDPATALRALDGFVPDVAVLDIGLPVIDGYELAQRLRLRLHGRPCRLVALTGYGQEADRRRSDAAGFEHHLVKPVQPDAIVALVGAGAATVG